MQHQTRVIVVCLILLLAGAACTVPGGLDFLRTPVASVAGGTALATLSQRDTPAPAVPTLAPTPTPLPTPTPDAGTRIARARQEMELGNYAAAAASYESVLALGPAADEAGQAEFGLGVVHEAAGEHADAVVSLRRFLADHPDSERVQDAHYFLAEALVGAGQPLAGAEEYEAYLSAGAVITAYVNEWLGDALHSGGNYESAAEAYQAAIAAAPDRSFLVGARERLALTKVAQQDYDGAVGQYDAILAVAQSASYRARIEYQAAQTLLLAGEAGAAYDRYLTAVESYPQQYYAYLSLVELVQAGLPPDDYLRGVVDYYGEAYGPALDAFARYIRDHPQGDLSNAHWYAGLSYLESGSPSLAASQFGALIGNDPGTPHYAEAWLKLGEAYADEGNTDLALATYQALADKEPGNSRAPEALWRAALLLDRTGALEDSAAAYMKCHVAYPNSEYGATALFRSGLQYYRVGHLIQAAVAWDTLAEIYPTSDLRPGALFWLGKVRQQQGDLEAAADALGEAARLDAVGWYGLRALDLLVDPLSVPFPQEAVYSEDLQIDEKQDAEAWLKGWLGLDAGVNLDELTGSLADDPRLQRGLELWRLGRVGDAKSELEALRAETDSDPVAQYQLGLLFQDVGLYRSSILCAVRLIALSPADNALDVPKSIARMAYPLYYEDLIVQSAKAQGLPPLLVFALIRQESLFEGMAFSSASAHGLMQVIPSTGQGIADELGWPPGYQTSDLHLPYINVRFGAYYLARQRDLFGGNLEVALAAYNGGPGNTRVWLQTSGDSDADGEHVDPDLFLELIRLSETRWYLIQIKSHLSVYRALYGDSLVS